MRQIKIVGSRILSIRQKLFLFILLPIVIVFISALAFILIDFQVTVRKNTEQYLQSLANNYSVKVQNELNYFIELNRFLKQAFESYANIPEENRRKVLSQLMYDLLEKNPKVLSIWSIWELKTIDNLEKQYANKPGSTILGNFRYLYFREGSQIKLSDYVEQNPSEVYSGKLYNTAKTQGKEVVVTHFYLDYNQNSERQILQTNIVMPIYHDSKFVGVVGVDMELENIQKMIQDIGDIKQGETYLFSNNGMCISSPFKENHGVSIDKLFSKENSIYDLLNSIKNGVTKNFSFKNRESYSFYTLVTIKIGQTDTPWALMIKLPYSFINNQTIKSVRLALLGGIISTILILIIIVLISNNISKPLITLSEKMDMMGHGELGETYVPDISSSSEIHQIAESYNKVSQAMMNSTRFAEAIGSGKLDSDYELLGEKDHLGRALLDMQEKLKKSEIDHLQREEEDRKRFWSSEGIAKLNEILRQHDKIENYTFTILSFLVKYINANQGGVFLINNDDKSKPFVELKSFYAYERRKYYSKTFGMDEGLIGSCIMEGETIYLTEIPDTYIKVKSGLGGSNPRSLLLVPLRIENDILGVIELASFHKLEQYQIQFLEQASSSIASSLKSAESNQKTKLLLETTQQQAEEMLAQEEEMRQNMEELQATQEESARRIEELERIIQELKSSQQSN